MTTQLQERLAVVGFALSMAAVPLFGHYYEGRLETRTVGAKPPGGRVRVYHLTGVAKPGMWTLDTVAGHSYWRHPPRRFTEMAVNKGDTVLVTLTSADVQHAFTIPALNIGPIEVDPGHRKALRFVADRAGSFPFLCARVCSCTGTGFACTVAKKVGHEGMAGFLTVTEPMGPPNVTQDVTISAEKGFQPPVIKVHTGDVVQLHVTSRSSGTGSGVGFCISDYETKVDLQGIASGDSRTFKFRADKPGSFTVYSSTRAGEPIDSATGTFVVSGAPSQR